MESLATQQNNLGDLYDTLKQQHWDFLDQPFPFPISQEQTSILTGRLYQTLLLSACTYLYLFTLHVLSTQHYSRLREQYTPKVHSYLNIPRLSKRGQHPGRNQLVNQQ